MNIQITRATVVLTNHGKDRISLDTEYPSPTPKVDPEPLSLTFEAEKGTGVEYVKDTFGIEPKVIDARTKVNFKFTSEE